MGSPKAWLALGGKTFLQRVVRSVGEVCSPVIVVRAPDQALPPLPDAVTIVADAVTGRGPLQGMAAGFQALANRASAAFVSSTDVPFLHPALVRRLSALRVAHGVDIVVPRIAGHLHPLSAVYALEARAHVERLLEEDMLRTTHLFERMRTLVADADLLLADPDLLAADPELRSLRNVNTPSDYEQALRQG
jgi:molybdenum cofactor guanylyltransferase